MSVQESQPDQGTQPETSPAPATDLTDTATPAFVAELADRVARTRATIDAAVADGDDDLAQAFRDDLHSLVDLAEAHDITLPDTDAYLSEQAPDREPASA